MDFGKNMAPSSGELWGHHLMPQLVVVDCLLPNGVIVPLRCYRESPLDRIKEDLWREARNFPLFELLQDAASYIFVSITQDAEREEFYDETRRLCDLRLFQPILKVVEPEGNKEEKMLNYEIGIALGLPVHELDEMMNKDLEVMEFRRNILNVTKAAVEERDRDGKKSQALYAFPPEIEKSALPRSLEEKLDKEEKFIISIWQLSPSCEKQKYTVAVNHKDTPLHVIRHAIHKSIRNSTEFQTEADKMRVVDNFQNQYLLKVAGSDQYFLQNCQISQYKYIRQCLAKSDTPHLMLMSKDRVYASLPSSDFRMPSWLRRPYTPSNAGTVKTQDLWRQPRSFRLHIQSASRVYVKDVDMIYVRVGVYHGTEPLCLEKQSKQVSPGDPKWQEWLDLDINMPDLPRSAKLCLSICSVRKRKGREEHMMLSWANVNMFDFRHRLLAGSDSLNLWGVPKGNDDLLNPLGSTGTNPNSESPNLSLEFETGTHPIVFPDGKQIQEYAEFLVRLDSQDSQQVQATSTEIALLRDIEKRDPLSEISEQEKELLWKYRHLCRNMPNILPRLLDAVKWQARDEVSQLYILLQDWDQVSTQTSLELLDCKYADLKVREKAVIWLDNTLSDEELGQYLLQLVQTLKYEPYLDNPLARMLLRRALLNRKIGHFFFWHLKSEISSPNLVVRFGLILEAYCRGQGSYLKHLKRQVEALDKLIKLTDQIKSSNDTQERRLRYLCDQISQDDYMESLQNFYSPLENTLMLGELQVTKCRVMDSAKKPLWLVWLNPDPLADKLKGHERNAIIFKNGDDLRQDMLTLQVIAIMDSIWNREGMDLRMMPYNCLATGSQVGMIEVVRNAITVHQIQKRGGRIAALQLDSSQLYKWIRDNNKPTENNKHKLEQAIETFTNSCAGYCVATFILGIGDRHPDNIMVNEDGQIFHIDFGHFLGHYKKKFGINRERVPFVLPDDFIYAISNGSDNPQKSKQFERFQETCGKAYMALRKHANLLITLFTMMLPTGITELQSINDVGYLRKTLAVEKTDKEALAYFQNNFSEAYGGGWTTKLDWFFHGVKHGV